MTHISGAGNVWWAKAFGGTDWDAATGIASDLSGYVYISGYFRSPSITFESSTLSNAGASNIFILKTLANGVIEWATSAGGSYSDIANEITTDQQGNIFIAGDYSSGSVIFGSTALDNSGFSDVFLAKMVSEEYAVNDFFLKNSLFSIYPNPSAGSQIISFNLTEPAVIDLTVFNMLGEKISAPICRQTFSSGQHEVSIHLQPGCYTVSFKTGQNQCAKKTVIF